MNRYDKRRQKIFEVYSSNLSNVSKKHNIKLVIDGQEIDPSVVHVYICPLCCKGFSRELLDQKAFNNPLTIEDVPPESVQGKPILLTCKACNNNSGHKVDHAIQAYLKAESFIKRLPDSEIRTKIKLNSGRSYNATAKIETHRGITFSSNPNPKIKEDFKDLEKNWNRSNVKFSFQMPAKKALLFAYLRTGLLLAFYYFGNMLLLDKNYHKLRKCLTENVLEHLPHNGWMDLTDKENYQIGLNLIKEPKEYICYVITFRVTSESISKVIGVPIPGPGSTGWKRYVNLKHLDESITLSLLDITTADFVGNLQLSDAYYVLYSLAEKGQV